MNDDQLDVDEIEKTDVAEMMCEAYLDYAMYVLGDRAIPHIADGLKPVQRRILYAMSELGLGKGAKHKKSARTVGDVLGKYHPHGDSACYEAMVLLAQDFATRYPLIDGQGNWGSNDDPGSFAAMRYTEARLTPITDLWLSELGHGATEWKINFDGTMREPNPLPARLPGVLLNGATGIAVGMATDLPPHNIGEITDACVTALENAKASDDEICAPIYGPDWACGAKLLTTRENLKEIYKEGQGNVRVRAQWAIEGNEAIITEIPPQTTPARIALQIADQIRAKKLPGINDVRDESDESNPIRLVIETRSQNIDTEAMMHHLCATTDVERTVHISMTVVDTDGRPKTMSLIGIIRSWTHWRIEMVRKRTQKRLEKVLDRMHIVEGLLKGVNRIEEVVRIVRASNDPETALMKEIGLSERQAQAVLAMRLRALGKLEEKSLVSEHKALDTERKQLEALLGSERRLRRQVAKEVREDGAEHGDARRTQISTEARAQRNTKEQSEAIARASAEPVTVVVSRHEWIRAAKGHDVDPESLSYREGDSLKCATNAMSHHNIVLIDEKGRTYSVLAHSLASARGHGEPLAKRIAREGGTPINIVVGGEDNQQYMINTSASLGFRVQHDELVSDRKAGKACVNVSEGAKLMEPLPIKDPENDRIALVTSDGHIGLIAAKDLPRMAKGKGVWLIDIPARIRSEVQLTTSACVPKGASMKVYTEKRWLTYDANETDSLMMARGKRGKRLPKGYHDVRSIEVIDPKQAQGNGK